MKSVFFLKYSVLGNDFVLLKQDYHSRKEAIEAGVNFFSRFLQVAHRRFGIGFDGLVVFYTNSKKEKSKGMVYWNADGEMADLCGNALRALSLCLVQELQTSNIFSIETAAGEYGCEVNLEKEEVIVELSPAIEFRQLDLSWKDSPNSLESLESSWFVNTGVPHLIFLVKERKVFEEASLKELGAFWSKHPLFPEGVNVNLAFKEENSCSSVFLRTYERGVWEETLSCGTGAHALERVLRHLFCVDGEIKILMRGGELTFFLSQDKNKVYVKGKAKKIFSGFIE